MNYTPKPEEYFYHEGSKHKVWMPWKTGGFPKFVSENTAGSSLLSLDRCWIICSMLKHALRSTPGDVWECGVFKGGTSRMMHAVLEQEGDLRPQHLFDTFEGMPETDPDLDTHKEGHFTETSFAHVKSVLPFNNVNFHKGFIPDTFEGMEDHKIAFLHLDVDIYKSTLDCLEFIWERMGSGGIIVTDDYGFHQTQGGQKAFQEYFDKQNVQVIYIQTAQAFVIKT